MMASHTSGGRGRRQSTDPVNLRGGQDVREGREWRAGVPTVIFNNDTISGERRKPQPSSGPLLMLVSISGQEARGIWAGARLSEEKDATGSPEGKTNKQTNKQNPSFWKDFKRP